MSTPAHPTLPPAPYLNRTLTDLLLERVEEDPDAIALEWAGGQLSWTALNLESDRLAAGLAFLGIGKGDVVSCQLPNIPEFLILHHAVAKRRAIFNPIHMAYRSAEVERILDFAQSAMLVVGPPVRGYSYVDTAVRLKEEHGFLRQVVLVGEPDRGSAIPFGTLCHEGDSPHNETSQPGDPFLLLFTSGTTSNPKATLHTHNMRLSNSWFCGRDMELRKEDRILCCSQLSHMWGVLNYFSGLIYGCRQILLKTFRPELFAAAVEEAKATVAIGAPAHAIDLLDLPALDPAALSDLRLFALSGAVCPPTLIRRFYETLPGCTPLVFWGMTETGGGCYTRLDDSVDRIENTTGRASGPCVLGILNAEGGTAPSEQTGELAIKTPFGIDKYLKNSQATAESFTRDGWFRTGDLATIDSSGYVRILGRLKDEINRGGMKFLPESVEQLLLRHPTVRSAAIVGVPDPRLGERTVCFVVPVEGQPPATLEELWSHLTDEGVAKFKWPEQLEIVDDLPVTPTGKIKRDTLRQLIRKSD